MKGALTYRLRNMGAQLGVSKPNTPVGARSPLVGSGPLTDNWAAYAAAGTREVAEEAGISLPPARLALVEVHAGGGNAAWPRSVIADCAISVSAANARLMPQGSHICSKLRWEGSTISLHPQHKTPQLAAHTDMRWVSLADAMGRADFSGYDRFQARLRAAFAVARAPPSPPTPMDRPVPQAQDRSRRCTVVWVFMQGGPADTERLPHSGGNLTTPELRHWYVYLGRRTSAPFAGQMAPLGGKLDEADVLAGGGVLQRSSQTHPQGVPAAASARCAGPPARHRRAGVFPGQDGRARQ